MVVKTVDVVSDGVCGVVLGLDVTGADVVLVALCEVVDTTTMLLDVDGDEFDTTRLLVELVARLVEVVATTVGVDVGVLEGLVTADELGTVGLLGATDDGVLVKMSEVDTSTLLIGVLVDTVEAGVEAD